MFKYIADRIYHNISHVLETIGHKLNGYLYAMKVYLNENFDFHKIERNTIMENMEWYRDWKFDDLAGIHVRAKLKNGALLEGRLYEWSDDTCAIDTTLVLRKREQKIYKDLCIESVDYVWDEKDYEQISWENLKEGDYVVSNGILMMVDSIERYPTTVKVVMNHALPVIEIPSDLVSEVLRHKQDLPTNLGIYKADHCRYIMLVGSRKQWVVVKDDYTVELYEHDELCQ